MLLSTILGFVFLWSTVVIHPGNPQTYDIFFSLFILLYISSLSYVVSQPNAFHFSRKRVLMCFASGFFLSMAELMRVFMVFLLPVLLFFSYQALKNFPAKYYLYFLTPIVLFSGVWHFYIALQHRQITWTNHSGQNLRRAWPEAELPMLVPEVNDRPLALARWPNLNTVEHYENSRRIQKAILRYVLENPIQSASNIVNRLSRLLAVQTSIYGYEPSHWVFCFYKPLVWGASFWLFTNALLLSVGFARYRCLQVFSVPANMLIIITLFCFCILAIGEAGEEARFLISVLPLVAALPSYGSPFGKRGAGGYS